ncbi:MAG: proton-conducting transporter membrane subunit [Planctomycetaceae bacterium]
MPIPSAPTMLLAVGGMALLLGRWLPVSRWYERVWLTAIVGACWLIFADDAKSDTQALDGATTAWIADSLAQAGQFLALLTGVLYGVGSFGIVSPRERTAERFGFLSLQIAGAMLVACANDLISLALSLEIVQFASWGQYQRQRAETWINPQARDLKPQHPGNTDEIPLWLGIISSCCLWLGIAVCACLTASTHFDDVRRVLADAYGLYGTRATIGTGSKLGLLAFGLMVAGLGGRIGLVPWQMGLMENTRHLDYWTTGCLQSIGQLTAVLALARLCGSVWVGYRDDLLLILLVAAGMTSLVVAGLAGLDLKNGEGRLRRWTNSVVMLQGAWLTVGVIAVTAHLASPEQQILTGSSNPLGTLIFALGGSQMAMASLFLMLSYLTRDGRDVEFIDELLGLVRLRPLAAITLVVTLASLVSQPPLWGFWSNWLLLMAGLNVPAVSGREIATSHVGVIALLIATTAASLMMTLVVLRIVRILLLERPISRTMPQGKQSALWSSCFCIALLIAIGIFPGPVVKLAFTVRFPEHRGSPDVPTGSSRGTATASRSP